GSDVPSDPSVQPLAASIHRGTGDEDVTFISQGGGGSYLLQVSNYNDATSTTPYLLYVREQSPPGGLTCAARTFPHAGEGSYVADSLTPGATGPSALYLVSTKRLADMYGASAATNIMNDLASVAQQSNGRVVQVDASAQARAAFTAWDASPCDI